jgi:hypothetical protein
MPSLTINSCRGEVFTHMPLETPSAAKIRWASGRSKLKGMLDWVVQLFLVKTHRLVIGFMAGDLESGLEVASVLIRLESGQALKPGDAALARQ